MRTRRECITYQCNIPDRYLEEDYDLIPIGVRMTIDAQGGLPCDGGGIPGSWCMLTSEGHGTCQWFGGRDVEDDEDY